MTAARMTTASGMPSAAAARMPSASAPGMTATASTGSGDRRASQSGKCQGSDRQKLTQHDFLAFRATILSAVETALLDFSLYA
jgi:hypothetical protein